MSSIAPFDHREFMLMQVDFDKYPLVEVYMEAIARVAAQGRSYLIKDDDGFVLAAIGLQQMWEGVYNIFIVPSIQAHGTKATAFIKSVFSMRKQLDKWVGDLNIFRMQTNSPDDEQHRRWMTVLGFKCEGVLLKYGLNKENHLMWSLTWQ